MKSPLKFIALFSLFALATAAVAEVAGASLPRLASAEAAISLFVGAIALMTFANDYARPAGRPRSRRPRLLPAAEAFAAARPGAARPLGARARRPAARPLASV